MKRAIFVVATVAAALVLPTTASTRDTRLRETVTVVAEKPISKRAGEAAH